MVLIGLVGAEMQMSPMRMAVGLDGPHHGVVRLRVVVYVGVSVDMPVTMFRLGGVVGMRGGQVRVKIAERSQHEADAQYHTQHRGRNTHGGRV